MVGERMLASLARAGGSELSGREALDETEEEACEAALEED